MRLPCLPASSIAVSMWPTWRGIWVSCVRSSHGVGHHESITRLARFRRRATRCATSSFDLARGEIGLTRLRTVHRFQRLAMRPAIEGLIPMRLSELLNPSAVTLRLKAQEKREALVE